MATDLELVRADEGRRLKGERPVFIDELQRYPHIVDVAEVAHLRERHGRREVDLIVERPDGGVVALEVKLSQTVDGDAVVPLALLGP